MANRQNSPHRPDVSSNCNKGQAHPCFIEQELRKTARYRDRERALVTASGSLAIARNSVRKGAAWPPARRLVLTNHGLRSWGMANHRTIEALIEKRAAF